jgi:hypothetical protein
MVTPSDQLVIKMQRQETFGNRQDYLLRGFSPSNSLTCASLPCLRLPSP